MSKKGFKPKWTAYHDDGVRAIQEEYFGSKKLQITSNPEDFVKALYAKV